MSVEAHEDVRMRAVLRDLVALSAFPAVWIESEPPAVAAGLADALVEMLQLDFAFVRLSDPVGVGAVEVARGSPWNGFPEWLEAHLTTNSSFPPKEVALDAGDELAPRRGFVVPVGVNGHWGVIAAASERSDFPASTDQLLLSVAANQAAVAYQRALLIRERKRAEVELRKAHDELEMKVAARTAELHVANDELSALRRVATLVAERVQPEDLFAVVAEEVASVVDVPLVRVMRYERDGTATQCATFSTKGPTIPFGKRSSLEGMSVLSLVRESSEAARIDDYSGLKGEIAEVARRWGIRSAVGSPIVVAGRLWGAVVASSTEQLPAGTEARLADFTQLLATAIANAESREALGRLADEQAALRRVATLVAQGVPPAEIFSAVSQEVGGLFGSDLASVTRFDADGPANVVVGLARSLEGITIGTRFELDDGVASAEVYRTGRSARVDAIDWSRVRAPIGEAARRLGVVSTVVSPIVVEGRLWGAMSVSSTDELLSVDAEERLEKFTELVGIAIANAEGKSDLAASRRRIVAASDEARRRIERDLHDGVQQQLVSLRLEVGAVEAALPPDDELRADLARVTHGLAGALEDLVEIARGIHPAILSHGGLGPALKALARRSAVPVALEARLDDRLPEQVGVAAYYVVSEALANAAKHARASVVHVDVFAHDGTLRLSIRDDGVGGADAGKGSGLLGLQDRVEALGGTIVIESPPGSGTSLLVTLPLVEPMRG